MFQLFASLLWYDPQVDGYQTDFRYLIPRFGRWLTPDLLGGDIGNPQSLNRYAYVLNNPTTSTDPLGLQNCPPGTKEGPAWGQCSGNAQEITSLQYGWGLIGGFGGEAEFGLTEVGTTPSVTYAYQYSAVSSATASQVYDDNDYYIEVPYLVAPPTLTVVGVIFSSSDPGIVFESEGPTEETFVSVYSYKTTIQKLKQAGFVQHAADYIDFFHFGARDLRDQSPFCSAHLSVNYVTHEGFTTGTAHVDTVNPWAGSPVPGPGGAFVQALGHAVADMPPLHLFPSSQTCP